MIGLMPCFFAFFIEIDHAEHGAVVGDGQAFHAQLLGAGNQVADAGGSVQQAVFRMNVQMCKSHVFSFLPCG